MEITKEELIAYTEAATKTATALEKIADRLVDISGAQKNCQDKFCSQMIELVKTNHSLLLSIDERSKDITLLKWLWFSLAGVVGLGMIVLEVFNKFHN